MLLFLVRAQLYIYILPGNLNFEAQNLIADSVYLLPISGLAEREKGSEIHY